jgi:hypothetical protein
MTQAPHESHEWWEWLLMMVIVFIFGKIGSTLVLLF